MPPVVIPDTLQVACSGLILGQPWVNVYGVNMGGPHFTSQTTANDIGGVFRAMYASLASLLTSSWSLTQIVLYDLQSGTAPSYEASIATLVGTNVGNAMPPGVAACVTHRTALRGRRYRGRTYLAGLTENANDAAGVINSTDRTTIANAFATLRTNLAALATSGGDLAVISRAAGVSTPIVSSSVDSEWDHQDRRKRA